MCFRRLGSSLSQNLSFSHPILLGSPVLSHQRNSWLCRCRNVVHICCCGKRARAEVRVTEVIEVGLGPRELQRASAGQPTLSPSPRPPRGGRAEVLTGCEPGSSARRVLRTHPGCGRTLPHSSTGKWRGNMARSHLTRVSSGPLSWPCARPLPSPHEGTPGPGEKPRTGSPRIEHCAPTTGCLGTECGEVWGRGWGLGRRKSSFHL